jgi:hypothetical protein
MPKKQPRLPGMQDDVLEDIQAAALEYVEHRDERMKALKDEVELKQRLLGLMKRHRKTEYIHDGIEVRVETEEETVKVKVKKPKKADGAEE